MHEINCQRTKSILTRLQINTKAQTFQDFSCTTDCLQIQPVGTAGDKSNTIMSADTTKKVAAYTKVLVLFRIWRVELFLNVLFFIL